jgi:hypothetical protein
LEVLTTPVRDLAFFIHPKWAIASRSTGSGNTSNIGSITLAADLFAGNGPFNSEEEFDEFWLARG